MKILRAVGFMLAMFMAIWATMKVFRFVGFMLATFLAALAAVWIYDTHKSTPPATGREQPTALVESTTRTRAIRQEQAQYGLLTLAGLEVSVSEVYWNNGELPSANREAGLSPPEDYRSEIIASVRVSAGGIITVHYASFPGVPDAWLRVVPKVSKAGLPIIWHCETNIPDMPQALPTCAIAR